MSMVGPGALRGAIAAVVLVLVVITLPLGLSGDASAAWVTWPFVLIAGLLGAVCGTIAGHLLDSGHTWPVAAAASGATAVAAVVAVLVVFTDGQLTNDVPAALVLFALLAGGATVLAAWQSRAMARHQDRHSRRTYGRAA